jgi:uncharacterized protein (DUF58 family)
MGGFFAAPPAARRGIAPPSGTEARGLLGGSLVVIGAISGASAVVLLGLVVLLLAVIHAIWARWGLRGVTYGRTLATDRAVFGDRIPLDITVRNGKRLPLAWLQAEDRLRPALPVVERPPAAGDRPEILPNAWTLGPFERVVRRYHLVAARRGVFEIGPTRLRVGDLFGSAAAEREDQRRDVFLVRPRILPIRERRPAQRREGDLRARHGLLDNTALYAGIREYRAGDPLRRVHWKASARLGQTVTRRFDPSRERDVVLALDIQGSSRRGVSLGEEEVLEGLCVVAASLARRFEASGASFGVAAAGFTGSVRPFAYLAPAEAVGQLGRVLDVLARLSSVPSAGFETLLTTLARLLRPGTTLAVVSARSPAPFLPALRRLAGLGFPVLFVAFGPDAERNATLARKAGLAVRTATLDAPGRTATAHELGG